MCISFIPFPIISLILSPCYLYLCRWHSSLWKLLWKELLVYTISFLSISFIYRFIFTASMQENFALLVRWCAQMYTGNHPIQ